MPTATHLTSSYNNVDATSFATASISPTASRWLVADVWSRDDVGSIAAPTITGLSLSWTTEHTKIPAAGTHQVTRAYAATGGSPGSGAITFNFGAATHDGCAWIVYELSSDVDAADPFVQSVSIDVTGTSISVTLAAFGSSDNRPLICAAHRANEISNPEAGYTEIGDVSGTGPDEGFAAAYHGTTTDTTPSYSWVTNTSPCIAIASEIKAAIVAGTAAWELGWVS